MSKGGNRNSMCAWAMSLALGPVILLALPAAAQDAPEPRDGPAANAGSQDDDALDELLLADEPAPAAEPAADAGGQSTAAPDAGAEAAPRPAPYEDVIPVGADRTETPPLAARPPPGRGMIEEVVVTARRTAENLQDVPVAISALSGDDLLREQINSPQDLQGRVPSLLVGTGSQMRNTETPTVRGQGAQFGASPGVVLYLGEVPLPSDPIANYQGGAGKFFDLSNVQILKGSQGTLFGRNTTGGARCWNRASRRRSSRLRCAQVP